MLKFGSLNKPEHEEKKKSSELVYIWQKTLTMGENYVFEYTIWLWNSNSFTNFVIKDISSVSYGYHESKVQGFKLFPV